MAHRTALITAGSIAAVLFAAAVAIGANLGILSVADSSPVGKLSAASSVPSATKVVQVYTGIGVPQQYVIKKAGTVTVALTKRGLRLVDVSAKPRWRWSLAQTAQRRLTVTFRSHGVTYTFTAVVGQRHTILARVVHPITRVVTKAAPAISTSWSATPVARPAAATPPAPAATNPASQRAGEGGNGGGGGDD